MVQTKEGGSVLSFIVIGVVLATLFISGVYFVHRQTQPPESPAPAPMQPEKTKQQPAEQKPQAPSPEKKNDQAKSAPQQSTPSPSNETAGSNELPQTGPAGILASLAALGLLSAASVSYVRSRRLELSL